MPRNDTGRDPGSIGTARDMDLWYDRLWFWNEARELCSLLAWPAGGASLLAALWHACTGSLGRALASVLVGLALAAAFIAASRASEKMSRAAVDELNALMRG